MFPKNVTIIRIYMFLKNYQNLCVLEELPEFCILEGSLQKVMETRKLRVNFVCINFVCIKIKFSHVVQSLNCFKTQLNTTFSSFFCKKGNSLNAENMNNFKKCFISLVRNKNLMLFVFDMKSNLLCCIQLKNTNASSRVG